MTQQYEWGVATKSGRETTVTAERVYADPENNLVAKTDDILVAIFARGEWESAERKQAVQPVVINVVFVTPPPAPFRQPYRSPFLPSVPEIRRRSIFDVL